MKYIVAYACVSHVGKLRQINQDNYICGQTIRSNDISCSYTEGTFTSGRTAMLGAFDGLGGEERGEIASLIAAEKASRLSFGRDIIKTVIGYCDEVNNDICEYVKRNSLSHMGTTVALLVFGKKEIILCNVGDSKIFRISNGNLKQISYDHVIDAVPGQKPLLIQNLGIPIDELKIIPYLSRGDYFCGDKYLICSDGLTDMVSTEKIREIIQHNDLKHSVNNLLQIALENGGRDNITIIVTEIRKH